MASNVVYTEDGSLKPVDGANFNMDIKEKVSTVGATGSGKDELSKLIARLIFPTAGRINIDGRNIVTIPEGVLGRRQAYVGPGAHIFTGTVMENLLYGLKHEPGKLHRPEYDGKDKFAGQPEVHSGRFAANFFTVFSTHDACLYRTIDVDVKAGDAVRVTVMAMSVAHDKDNPHNHGTHGLRVGIDPAGGEKFDGLNVRYGDWYASHDSDYQERKWVKLTAEAIAEADKITVFMHSRAEFAVQISASHWDDLVVEVLDA